MTALPDIALGAVIAALIAGAISLSGLIISKENKTSEFRQAWIDALRCETAKLIAQAHALDGAIGANFESRVEIWEKTKEHWSAFKETAVTIRLRLNPDEDQSKEILVKVEELERLFGETDDRSAQPKAPPRGAVSKLAKELTDKVNVVLRADWKRVKDGEPRYRRAVALSTALLVVALITLVINSFLPRRQPPSPPQTIVDSSITTLPAPAAQTSSAPVLLPSPSEPAGSGLLRAPNDGVEGTSKISQ